ncbi:MAG TPA: nucleotide pyrophosphatase/phosphodiesterase family protein [Actinomycetes bacterium]|nr:nucleotide pyrophosphatase/phosphodiesterase family protein [Actinomycetes bacterium]
MSTLDRRTFLRRAAGAGTAAVLGGGTVLGAPPAAAKPRPGGATPPRRVYVLVVDGCRPDEVVSGLMPRLAALRATGTNYPAARSLPVMETIPNHVMMMSGVRPDRSGVPANQVYDRAAGEIRDLDRPTDLRFETLLERLRTTGRTTASVLSKRYLHGIFDGRATHAWDPAPEVPVSGHAPDAATVEALIDLVDAHDPDLVFANLGDVDRFGHSDLTGSTLQAARKVALADTDTQVGRFLDHLTSTGRYADSVLLVLADHSMDWSLPGRIVSLTPVFDADPLLSGRFVLAQNGGADLAYWTGPDAERTAAVARMRALATATDGVLAAHPPEALRLGPEAGDLVLYCRAGWRFTEPQPYDNPIPGNHGHPATEPIPFFVSGGSPLVRRGATSTGAARPVDIAPTVGALFGLPAPTGGSATTVSPTVMGSASDQDSFRARTNAPGRRCAGSGAAETTMSTDCDPDPLGMA